MTTLTTNRPSTTHRLLTAAAIAGPSFYAVAIAQMLTRDGFDLRVHPISQLATGSLGWIQMISFVLTGLGVIALAVARRRLITEGTGRRTVPLFLGLFGAGLVIAGLFPMDPQNGFPAGAPDGTVAMSWHSVVHSAGAAVAFTALAVACIVLVVDAVRRRATRAAVGHGVVALVMLIPVSPTGASVQIALTGAVAFTWTTVYAVQLTDRRTR
ncbi:DUF998 domain-containing protein [Kribbella italica]|uniref:Putative membrane protein n=1 Tax=Kribbella italica TaxID=1540520 RepID=A0A7W9JF94_9ACTN|nr:DUF998 domain-containing protein [Kribbella italica]MBB5841046.1 putative membrane protein [Kribbella italica]